MALRHANASCKTWRYGQPNEGEETFWPEPVVDLRNQGTGVLRALALVEKMGGSLDLRSESVSRLRLGNTLVSLFVLVPFAFWHMLALARLALPHKPPGSVVRSPLTLVPALGGERCEASLCALCIHNSYNLFVKLI